MIPGFFTPGTPLYTEAGGDALKGKRDIDGAKKLLAEAGYSGQPVTCLVAQDQPPLKAMGEVTADLLKKIGMTVDFVATDWGTVGQRRASKNPPGQGGWGMFHTWHARRRLRDPGELHRRARHRREGLVRLARRARPWRRRSRPGSRPRTSTRRRPIIGRHQQGGHGGRDLHPDRLLLRLPGLAQQCRAASSKGPLPLFWGVTKA